MADVFSRKKRSAVMGAIRSKNTKPEMIVQRLLSSMGFHYRTHVATMPGRPDIVLSRSRTIFQIKGCFWHGHGCLKGRVPAQNRSYWLNKISGNVKRDYSNGRRLRTLGWKVKTIWECQIRRSSASELAAKVKRLAGGPKTPGNRLGLSLRQLTRIDTSLSRLRSRKRGQAEK